MDNTFSSNPIIADLKTEVERLITELQLLNSSFVDVRDADEFEALEKENHANAIRLADLLSAIKLQEALNSDDLIKAEKDLVKSLPKKYRNLGYRAVRVRMLGGTQVIVMVPYYHQKSNLKKMQSKRGFHPRLLLLGIHDRCTPAFSSRVSLFATAACSLEESGRLMETLYGFKLDIKTIRLIFKRFAMRARVCYESGKVLLDKEFKGKHVVISTDGGRVRTRRNKKGHKTKKNRNRYHTDWREPKLILIYVVNEKGEKDRKISPFMDASLDGPDAIFSMLLYYLKKLGAGLADQLIFFSDGAVWIWERVNKLIADLGCELKQCWLVLDFYHAVEHLTSIATQKKWTKADAKKWVNKQRKRLLNGKLDILIKEVEEVCHKAKNKILLREREYFKTHLPRMRYKEIKDACLPIGSGGVESGIRRVVNMRLKGPGIFWKEEFAEAMLLLRSYYKAGRWNLLRNMAFIGGLDVE